VHSLPEAEWRAYVDQHPRGNIFHTPEMFQVFARAQSHKPDLWAAVQDGWPLALMLPVQITLIEGLLRPFTTRNVIYGGVLSTSDSRGKAALALLLRSYIQEAKGSPLFSEIRNMSDQSDIQSVLVDHRFSFEDHLNFLVDLDQPEEIIWRNLNKTLKKEIQAAQRSGLIMEEIIDLQGLTIGYKRLEQVFKRVRVPLPDFTLFQAAFEILSPKEMLKISIARAGENYIGVNFILLYKGMIFGWYMGSDRAFASFHPDPLMVWHILKWGKEHNYNLFDFGGAGRPNEVYGPRTFKAKFGGKLVNYGRSTCIHAPMKLKISRIGYQIVRKFL